MMLSLPQQTHHGLSLAPVLLALVWLLRTRTAQEQHTATHCNTLQHTATHAYGGHAQPHCNTLQHTATYCNTLQHTATHCNTL